MIRFLRISFYVGLVALTALAVFLAWKPPLMEDVSFSRAVFDRHGELLRLTLSKDEKYRLFVPLKDLSPLLRDAVLLHEDRYFYTHPGVNPAALARAFVRTYINSGRRMGASTITMQLARIKYSINSRHIPGKIWQMLRALQLEIHYDKDQLLEAYFNLAPYGYNVEGAGAASFIYFRKKPEALTLPESLTLAVIPQSPARRRPEKSQPNKPALIQARNRLFSTWLENHPEHANQQHFFNLPLTTYSLKDLPFTAPHLTQYLLARFPNDARITATVDRQTQLTLESILQRHILNRQALGVNNASALLVDTRTMQIMASIGSADFTNSTIQGQVDGTRARRSPGSALKPFIYALALDQGLIHPHSMLSDAPAQFGGYVPGNFDQDFRGPITAQDALRLSRNIPALSLAAQLRSPDLYTFLKKAGIVGLRAKKDYGLSLVLGGAEVTPREIAALYAMLANSGVLKPLVFRLNVKEETEISLLSPEASFLTLDMLRTTPRPSISSTGGLPVYWKTGTSNGFRDAWTAGVFGPYVLVVWVGNFSGEASPSLVGMHSAAPLFFALADAVRQKDSLKDFQSQKASRLNLRKVSVCAATGGLEKDLCPRRADTWFIPGVSPIRTFDVYRSILVNTKTGRRACHAQDGVTEYRTVEVWPTDLQQTFAWAGLRKPPLPAWEEGCDDTSTAGKKPVITSPQTRVIYQVRLGSEATEPIALKATADGDTSILHWFVNNRYLGEASPNQALFWAPQSGRHTVRVTDSQGRGNSVVITVQAIP